MTGVLFLWVSCRGSHHNLVITYIVTIVSASGDRLDWNLMAKTPCQALLAARELCPECEIVKIERKGEW